MLEFGRLRESIQLADLPKNVTNGPINTETAMRVAWVRPSESYPHLLHLLAPASSRGAPAIAVRGRPDGYLYVYRASKGPTCL